MEDPDVSDHAISPIMEIPMILHQEAIKLATRLYEAVLERFPLIGKQVKEDEVPDGYAYSLGELVIICVVHGKEVNYKVLITPNGFLVEYASRPEQLAEFRQTRTGLWNIPAKWRWRNRIGDPFPEDFLEAFRIYLGL